MLLSPLNAKYCSKTVPEKEIKEIKYTDKKLFIKFAKV